VIRIKNVKNVFLHLWYIGVIKSDLIYRTAKPLYTMFKTVVTVTIL